MRLTCERCGESMPLPARGRTPRFCSTRCRVAAHRAKRMPAELTDSTRWVRHDAKRPINCAGRPASSTNRATWTTYRHANGSDVGDGLGFVLGDGFACLDLDHCLTNGNPNELARRILAETEGAYTEISPSGDGLHIWGVAAEQPGRKRPGVEAYSAGRYMTITGKVFRPGGLVDISDYF